MKRNRRRVVPIVLAAIVAAARSASAADTWIEAKSPNSSRPAGVVGGIEGGVVGGVRGGIVGGLQTAAPPPPPAPVRVGSNIKQPAKVKDVKPIYPAIAQSARVQGVVILEVTIAPNGTVSDTKVLRSIPLLDQAATDAVRQWAFEPTLLNGVRVPVLMTVTVNFTLTQSVSLKITDTKGTVTVISDAAIDYGSAYGTPMASGPLSRPLEEGVRVYQGDGQVIVKWSQIDTVTFTGRNTTAVPNRIIGNILLKSGQRIASEFVMPAIGGAVKGKIALGEFSIPLTNVVQLSPVETSPTKE